MSDFKFNNWNDEFFRREFLKFLNEHEKNMSEFMKKMYNQKPKENKDFKKINDYLNKMMGDFNQDLRSSTEKDSGEFGSWEKSSWISDDGSSYFTSYNRDYEPFLKKENLKNIDTVELLEEKLKKSIIDEDYESSAKIRDLIKDLENKSKK